MRRHAILPIRAKLRTRLVGGGWGAVGAVLDRATGSVKRYTHTVPSVAGHPLPHQPPGLPPVILVRGAVWVSRIATMASDQQGHLWYTRERWLPCHRGGSRMNQARRPVLLARNGRCSAFLSAT